MSVCLTGLPANASAFALPQLEVRGAESAGASLHVTIKLTGTALVVYVWSSIVS